MHPIPELFDLRVQITADLTPHRNEWDSVVVAGDHHGIALGALVAAEFGKPLLIVCPDTHGCVVSHITAIGTPLPADRYLYVDDFHEFGYSRSRVREYMSRDCRPPIVASYYATTRAYERITDRERDEIANAV